MAELPEDVNTLIAPEDGAVHVERSQDVEPVLERAKALAAAGQAWSAEREMLHVAEFPAVIVERYCNTKGITFAEFMGDQTHVRNMLADPDLAYFKVWDNVVHKTWRA